MTFEEAVRVVTVFKHLGVRTVRLTGGEPLVRKDVDVLLRMLRDEAGIEDLAMTSNATAMRKLATRLVAAGLGRLNVSMDSVRPHVFREMTRGGDLDRVMDGIRAAQDAGISELKINAVVVRGRNDDELPEIVQWAWDRGITPRFIELMPLGEGAKLGRNAVVSVEEMKERLGSMLAPDVPPAYRPDRGPAGYLTDPTGIHRVGFIGAVTDNFCHRCNRVRITARGEIRACLASPDGLSLRDVLRTGASDSALLERIETSLFGKRSGHAFYVDGVDRHHDVHMSRIGG